MLVNMLFYLQALRLFKIELRLHTIICITPLRIYLKSTEYICKLYIIVLFNNLEFKKYS